MLRAVRAIERADVAVLLIDATEGVLAQDAHVAGYVEEAAKGLDCRRQQVGPGRETPAAHSRNTPRCLRRELKFADWAPVLYLSATTGQRVDRVVTQALAIQAERTKRIPTPQLNDVVRQGGRGASAERARAHAEDLLQRQTGASPPRFMCFCNDPRLVHFSYRALPR